MATFRVTTPVAGFSGEVGGVHFANGVATVDDTVNAPALGYFRSQGYGVEDLAVEGASTDPATTDGEAVPKPAGNASTETWRTWAVQHGGMDPDEAATLSRDQLAERFASEEKS